MKTEKIITITFILIGFGLGGFFFIQNSRLQEEINTQNDTINDLYQSVSELQATQDLLSQEVETLEGNNAALSLDVETLEGNNAALEVDLTSLTNTLSQVISEKEALSERIIELEYDVTSLEDSLARKRTSFNRLESNYNVLQNNFYDLELTYNIEKELRIGNSLASYYDYLRENLGPTGASYWWYIPKESVWQMEVDFAANLAQHDLWRIYWPDYEPEYHELTGEYSYETAYSTLSTIVDLIDFSSLDSSVDKISRILKFLDKHIHYEYDINDLFLAPVETLGFKSGDCDDYSILASALFELVDIESAVGFFKNDENQYHAMVLVHLDDLGGYGYWCFQDLTDLGLIDGQWIIIEPQTTIDDQYSEWVSQWSLFVACELVE